ncbi:MAG: endonuclease/exonuclease/phosphatase family protein [Bacteroidales bacterium]|nr:endonuclease/exonuclease/phosphatase family protein [Bacteroidales bacterium]
MKRTAKSIFNLFLIAAMAVSLTVTSCESGWDGTVTVMSYNIRNSHADDGPNAWEIRRSATPAMLDAVNPDIFGVQEAYPEQEQYILEQCPRFKAIGVGRNDGADDGERMTVFYNTKVLEMEDGGTWWLSETPDVPSVGWDAKYPRTATWVKMKDLRNGKLFYFVNTHLDHKGVNARREGLRMVVSKIREMDPDIPMVFTGDFNVQPADSCLMVLDSLMLSARATAAVSDTTASFNGFKGPKTIIDYIYYSGFTKADEFRVVTESFDGKPFISDHYPIVSKLQY